MPDVNGDIIYEGDIVEVTDYHGHKNNWKVGWEAYSFMLIDSDGDGDMFGIYTRRFGLDNDTYKIIKPLTTEKTEEEIIL